MRRNGKHEMGRFSVEFDIANNSAVVKAKPGTKIPDGVPHLRIRGIVDSGATRLVLPESVASELQLAPAGKVRVVYADQRYRKRGKVQNVWLRLLGRDGVFSAIIEPDREDALIGAIVLEELDLLVDGAAQTLRPRDPKEIVAEIE
jgi:predicted aspartyl protease